MFSNSVYCRVWAPFIYAQLIHHRQKTWGGGREGKKSISQKGWLAKVDMGGGGGCTNMLSTKFIKTYCVLVQPVLWSRSQSRWGQNYFGKSELADLVLCFLQLIFYFYIRVLRMPFESYTTMYDTGISHKYVLNKSNILSSRAGTGVLYRKSQKRWKRWSRRRNKIISAPQLWFQQKVERLDIYFYPLLFLTILRYSFDVNRTEW